MNVLGMFDINFWPMYDKPTSSDSNIDLVIYIYLYVVVNVVDLLHKNNR